MALIPVALTAGKVALAGLSVVAGVREARRIAEELPRGELAGISLSGISLAGLGDVLPSIWGDTAKKPAGQRAAEKRAKQAQKEAKTRRDAAKRDAKTARKALTSQAADARREAVSERVARPEVSRDRARYAIQAQRIADLSAKLEELSDKLQAQGQTDAAAQALAQAQLVAEAGSQGAVYPDQLPEDSIAAKVLDALTRESADPGGIVDALGVELDPGDWGDVLSGEDALARVVREAELSGCPCGGLDDGCPAPVAGNASPRRQWRGDLFAVQRDLFDPSNDAEEPIDFGAPFDTGGWGDGDDDAIAGDDEGDLSGDGEADALAVFTAGGSGGCAFGTCGA